ncbi:MAG: DUF1294 domain-containing protein [Ruminococcaceae bacterium]|nr:DUF1294 domain-containing protein [Oscillospiraceae bacterium]
MIYNYILAGWNLLVMLFFGLDKLLAKTASRRISEKTLLLLSFALGGMGALFGMVLFNHKTSKPKFKYSVPIAALLTLISGGAILYFFVSGEIK